MKKVTEVSRRTVWIVMPALCCALYGVIATAGYLLCR